jgi:hypothetical protein
MKKSLQIRRLQKDDLASACFSGGATSECLDGTRKE